MKIDFILTNCADPDEMPHLAAFHLDLHCLPKYLFQGVLVFLKMIKYVTFMTRRLTFDWVSSVGGFLTYNKFLARARYLKDILAYCSGGILSDRMLCMHI